MPTIINKSSATASRSTKKTNYVVPDGNIEEEEDEDDDDNDSDGFELRYSETNKKLKILTQNLWIHYLAPSPCKTSRINAFIEYLRINYYDILIIQEIFALRFLFCVRCNHLKYLVCELYKIGFIHYTSPSGYLPYIGQNGGVMIFARYPFIYDDVYKFKYSDEIMLRKGFAIAITKIFNYYLIIGTGHCDPYRPDIILKQIEQFSIEIQKKYDLYSNNLNCDIDIIVGGDFNTRNKALTKGLRDYFENDIISMYNVWTLKTNDRTKWNKDMVTYRSNYLSKLQIWCSILSCGLIKLPSLKNIKIYEKGYCLDHLLTNINKNIIENVNVVDTRYKNVFVSDHMGVELIMKLPK